MSNIDQISIETKWNHDEMLQRKVNLIEATHHCHTKSTCEGCPYLDELFCGGTQIKDMVDVICWLDTYRIMYEDEHRK